MGYLLRCPLCRGKFKWNVKQGFPDDCPLCEAHIGHDRADDDIVAPSIRHLTTVATDKVYRDIESSSIERAEQAAQLAGTSVEDMAGLKITNLRDTKHNGDIAAMPVNNAVTQAMDAINARGGQVGFQGANGLGFSGPVMTGHEPNAGARFQSVLRQAHGERAGWDSVGDRPANEIFQPGYRPRA